MDKHVTILGIIYIAFGILGIVLAGVLFVAIAGGGWISHDRDAIAVTTTVASVLSFLLLFFSVPSIIGGIGVIRHARWARILVLILGVLNIVNIPLGTLLAIYTIWVLMNDETARLFASPSSSSGPVAA